jgi:diguanylate cyclase (GGDEF)-like protein/PAS domain S-box-containing protein
VAPEQPGNDPGPRKVRRIVRLDGDSYRRIVDNLYEGLYFVDSDRVITYWNKAAERISGYTADEVVGRRCHDNILTHIDAQGNQLCLGLCPLAATISDGTPREAEVYLHHKKGHRVPVLVRVTPLYDEKGEVVGGIELFSDISNQSANELRIRELEELAYIDTLTRLANRTFLEKELASRMEEQRRYGVPFGIFFMDIDHFKAFNDTYGHDVGDHVLAIVAETFTANSRPFDTFGRWGGEEFVGVMRNVDRATLEMLGNRYREAVAAAYIVQEGERLTVTISIGATLVRSDDTVESLIKRADSLLYRSKRDGRNRLTIDAPGEVIPQ